MKKPRMPQTSTVGTHSCVISFTLPLLRRAVRLPQACGAISAVRIATTPEGEKRGFAHVEFAERSGAEGALQLAGKELLGQAVDVKPAVAQQKREPREGPRVVAPGEPAPGCWFCLTNQKDVHLIVSIQNECYMALDKARHWGRSPARVTQHSFIASVHLRPFR